MAKAAKGLRGKAVAEARGAAEKTNGPPAQGGPLQKAASWRYWSIELSIDNLTLNIFNRCEVGLHNVRRPAHRRMDS